MLCNKLAIIGLMVTVIFANPDGAPPESCEKMSVAHGAEAQENTAPFQVVPLEVIISLFSWLRR